MLADFKCDLYVALWFGNKQPQQIAAGFCRRPNHFRSLLAFIAGHPNIDNKPDLRADNFASLH